MLWGFLGLMVVIGAGFLFLVAAIDHSTDRLLQKLENLDFSRANRPAGFMDQLALAKQKAQLRREADAEGVSVVFPSEPPLTAQFCPDTAVSPQDPKP